MRRGQKDSSNINTSKSDKDKPQKIRNELTDEQKREIKEAFSTFDQTGLEPEELRSAMQALGFDAKNPDVQKMLKAFYICLICLTFFARLDFSVET